MRCRFLQAYELRENSAIGIERCLSDGCGKEAVHLGGGHSPKPEELKKQNTAPTPAKLAAPEKGVKEHEPVPA